MRKTIVLGLCFSLLLLSSSVWAAPNIKVMLFDGESGGPYHAWDKTTPYLKRMLEDTGLFAVDVVTAPPKDGNFSGFQPKWSDYQVVVFNYDAPDERWPLSLKTSFEAYIRGGGGLVLIHGADNAFPNWREFNLMAGIGGWRGRDEKAGPMFFWQDGKIEADTSPGKAGSHGARLPFQIITREPQHPVMKGLPNAWMHVADELYAQMRGPGENMSVLATGYADPANKGTGRHEPILMAIRYGKGRVFHTVLGHDVAALNSVGFIVTYQRGTEWAATGKVTQKVPDDFPTALQPTTRKEYAPAANSQ